MIYDLEKMMANILNNWDYSIFLYGGDTSLVGYTEEQYKLLGYNDKNDKRDFQTDEFFEEFSFENSIQGHNIGERLNKDDKDLLIAHSSYLFNDIEEKEIIYRYMLKLALHLNRYRYLKTRVKKINLMHKIVMKNPKKNYSQEEKEEKLKKLIKDIILLMGGDGIVYSGVTDVLKQIRDNPHAYIPKKHFIPNNKNTIKSFLFSLNLKKPKEIDNFLKDIT